jgi:farnesyl-diphosphate farnesyltransferase
MTNILKDVWEDRQRGACWLPQDVFREAGFDLAKLTPNRYDPAFGEGLARLIGIAQGHLRNALEYTLHFPPTEVGIRRFCLWALAMAVLTLRKLHKNLDFRAGNQVKISHGSVRLTVLTANLTAGNDALLRVLFDLFTRRLPAPLGYAGITSRS